MHKHIEIKSLNTIIEAYKAANATSPSQDVDISVHMTKLEEYCNTPANSNKTLDLRSALSFFLAPFTYYSSKQARDIDLDSSYKPQAPSVSNHYYAACLSLFKVALTKYPNDNHTLACIKSMLFRNPKNRALEFQINPHFFLSALETLKNKNQLTQENAYFIGDAIIQLFIRHIADQEYLTRCLEQMLTTLPEALAPLQTQEEKASLVESVCSLFDDLSLESQETSQAIIQDTLSACETINYFEKSQALIQSRYRLFQKCDAIKKMIHGADHSF